MADNNMNRDELIALKVQFKRLCEAEVRACRAKWRRKADGIDLLLRKDSKDNRTPETGTAMAPNGFKVSDTILESIVSNRKEGVMEAVRRTLENVTGAFTSRTIVEYINKAQRLSLTERDVANPLWRLRSSGEINLLERGRGRKPSIYIKV